MSETGKLPEHRTKMKSPMATGMGSADPAERSSTYDPDRPKLVLLGVNHTTAPLDLRERLAIPSARLAEATRALARQPGVQEALILSTCNRVELLASVDAVPRVSAQVIPEDRPRLTHFLEEFCSVPPSTLGPHLYEFRELEAVRHLFRVACSLDSLVVGEAQILGQVKESWTVAREVGAVSQRLDPLLQRAFSVAKRVRSETRIGSTSVSVASVAVELARKIFGTLAGKQVLIVGAGKMAELAARHLLQHGLSTVLISNRTEERARQMAQSLDTQLPTQIIPFDQLLEHAHRADIVLTSTGAAAGANGHRIFTAAAGRHFLERRRNRPMFFIDIAVPRDVDPSMNEVDGCFVYDMDDLQQVASSNLANRSREAEAAETIVRWEVERYQDRLGELDGVPAIRALQERVEALRRAELERSAGRLADLTPGQREAVEALTRSLAAKLLHGPMAAIRSAAGAGDVRRMEELRAMYTGEGVREGNRTSPDQRRDRPKD